MRAADVFSDGGCCGCGGNYGLVRASNSKRVLGKKLAYDVSQFGFKEPAWVDLSSGAVYAFPKDAKTVPMCDSPCLLAERAAIDLK